MPVVTPLIDPSVARLAPGFRALSITVEDAHDIVRTDTAEAALVQACRIVSTAPAPWADAHLAAWAEVFRAFGAKPQRTPCSADALRRRVLRDGTMPRIHPVVDLYNAVSLQHAVPVGGENLAAYVGVPRLALSDGTLGFETRQEGRHITEFPPPGEVVWHDDEGVTCRRWNWRQSDRTRLEAGATRMWFLLESLPAMPLSALHAAGEHLVQGLRLMLPGASIDTGLIDTDDSPGR